MSVLSRVKHLVTAEIERCEKGYLEGVKERHEKFVFPTWPIPRHILEKHLGTPYVDEADSGSMFNKASIICDSLEYGYLKLESDRWLLQSDAPHGSPDFLGVSFDDVRKASRSMIDLRGWKIGTISLEDAVPFLRHLPFEFIPIVGAGVKHQAFSQRLQGDFKTKLSALVKELEEEDWGVDLTEISP